MEKENEDKLVLNVTYHPSLAQLKVVMTRIHLLLKPDNEHNKVFRDVPIIGSRRAKSLKDILVKAKVPQIKSKGGFSLLKDLDVKFANILYQLEILTSSTTKSTFEIRPENLNCRSKKVVYLISCKTCHKQ